MNRRDFLRRAAIVAAGAVAADQLEILERLTHRKVWPGANFGDGDHPKGLETIIADSDFTDFFQITTTVTLSEQSIVFQQHLRREMRERQAAIMERVSNEVMSRYYPAVL